LKHKDAFFKKTRFNPDLIHHERKDASSAGAFDGVFQAILKIGANAGDATWQNFAVVTQEAFQESGIFKINMRNAVGHKVATFFGTRVSHGSSKILLGRFTE
jgi:hypothetical protein